MWVELYLDAGNMEATHPLRYTGGCDGTHSRNGETTELLQTLQIWRGLSQMEPYRGNRVTA